MQEGASVIAVARRADRLEELKASLASAQGKIEIFQGDISQKEINEDMIDKCISTFGKIDVLVNNAGIMDDMGLVGDLTDEKFDQIIQVNLYGPMCAMRKAVNEFKKQNGGSIINIASLGVMRTAAGAAYCASKAAVISMKKNTAFMYQPDGIRCNAFAPGGIETEIANSMGQPNMAGYGRVQKVLAAAPAPGAASDIANAAIFIASDESSYISDDVLVVDGGWNAG